METIEDIVREMYEFSDLWVQSIERAVLRIEIQHFADRIKEAVKHKREPAEDVIREIVDCCSVNINCGNCGKSEDIYLVPKSLITKLESRI